MSKMIEPLPPETMADLVTANHILYNENIVDGFGHVSVRDPRYPDKFWLSRNLAPGLVRPKDVLAYDADSEPLDPEAPRSYAERYIHGEIYRKHPNVMAVVHTHAATLVPFGAVPSVKLKPIFHMAGFLIRAVPVFDIREHMGERNEILVKSREAGAALANTFGEGPAVLMRGHGATIVGISLRHAVFRAVFTTINAGMQADAMRLGEPIYLNEYEAAGVAALNDTHVNRPWELWAKAAYDAGLGRD